MLIKKHVSIELFTNHSNMMAKYFFRESDVMLCMITIQVYHIKQCYSFKVIDTLNTQTLPLNAKPGSLILQLCNQFDE